MRHFSMKKELFPLLRQWRNGVFYTIIFMLLLSVQAYGQTKLSGTVIGTSGSWNSSGNTRDKVFDEDINTFFDAPQGEAWAGLDLGSGHTISSIRFYPRSNYPDRMVGGKFQGSNSADFSSGVTDLHTITSQPAVAWTDVNLNSGTSFRYVRYLGPAGGYGNVSEIEFYGSSSNNSGSLPSGWSSQDIGTVAAAGNASASNGTFTIEGSGDDIWASADEFHYVYKSLSGDGEVIARVETQENTDGWAKAGVMIRESLTAGSKNAATVMTPANGAAFQVRTATGNSSTSNITGGLAAPRWVKIVRSGDSFTSFQSADGSSWTQIGSAVTVAMGAQVYAGLAVTSHSDGTLSTATFSNVSVGGGGSSGGGDGFVVREVWSNVTGTSVADIPQTTTPSSTSNLTSLEAPTDVADDYGTRIRGYVIPETSGSYTFHIASDDNSQLHLSNNDQPANTSKIAEVTGWTSSKEWNKYASQQSATQSLTAGNKYYFEVLHKEGGGGDNLAVGWTGPGISSITVLDGAFLSSFEGGDSNPVTYSLTVSSGSGDGSYEQGEVVNISADAAPSGQEFDKWTGDIANVADEFSSSTTLTMPASAVSVTATYKDQQTGGGTSLTVNKNTTHQTIDGFGFFGARDVWWGSSDPAHFYSDAWLDLIVSDLGVSIWRNELYPHNPPTQNVTSNQDAHWDKQKPMVQALKAKADQYGVDMKFILTVWSPPGEFKWWSEMAWAGDENALRGPSGDGDYWSEKNGGTLNPNKYDEYASWLNQGLQMYSDAGVNVHSISPQNEPSFAQSFNSCTYTTHWYADMINAVMPQVKTQHPGVKVFGSESMLETEGADHNYPYFYHSRLKSDPTALNHMDILAVHGYQDGVSASSGSELAKYWTNHKREFSDPANKKVWMTETSGYVDAWEGTSEKPGALSLAIDIQTGLYFGDLSGWVFWQGSGLGGINEYNLMSDMAVGKKYYASKNFYRFIRPGAVRLETSSPDTLISLTAYEHAANGTHTVILINTATTDKDISLAMTGSGLPSSFEMFVTSASTDCESLGNVSGSGTISLPARSVVTLQAGGMPLSGSSTAKAQTTSQRKLSPTTKEPAILEGLTIYPNPTNDMISVSYGKAKELKATVSTLQGASVNVKAKKVNGSLRFNMSGQAAGVYILKVEADGVSKSYRIMKK